MKKYLSILSIIIFSMFSVFLVKDAVFAKFPSFEIYGGLNPTPYPTVTNVRVYKFANFINITARAYDVVGVFSLAASIKDLNTGQYMDIGAGNGIMYDDGFHNDEVAGDNIYGTAFIDVSGWNSAADYPYQIDIFATDWLFHNSGSNYNNIKTFVISELGGTEIVDFTATPTSVALGDSVHLSATLQDADNHPIPNAEIVFTDVTDNNTVIGSTPTNSSGIAEIDYQIAGDATTGSHTLRASYSSGRLNVVRTTEINVYVPTITTVELWDDKNLSITVPVDPPREPRWYHVYNTYYYNVREQFVILADDLANPPNHPGLGLQPGDTIVGIQLKASTVSDKSLQKFRIRMKETTAEQTTSWEGGWTTFFAPPTDVLPVVGWNEYALSPVDGSWDGIWHGDNIMVDIARQNSGDNWSDNGELWWRTGVGTNAVPDRTFAGYTDESGMYDAYQGDAFETGGVIAFRSCPALKIMYERPQ